MRSFVKLSILLLFIVATIGCASTASVVNPDYAAYLKAKEIANAEQKPIVYFKAVDGQPIRIEAAEFAVYAPNDAVLDIRPLAPPKSGLEKFGYLVGQSTNLVLGLAGIYRDLEVSEDNMNERRFLYETFANMDTGTYYYDSFNQTGNFGDGSGDNRDNDLSTHQTGNFGDGAGDNRENDSSQTGNFGENSGDGRDNDSSQNGNFGQDIQNGPRDNDNSVNMPPLPDPQPIEPGPGF